MIDIIKSKGIIVRTGAGDLAIGHVQLEGGKEMSVDAFLRGHRIVKGAIFIS